MEGRRSQAAVFGKGCPWAQPLAAGGVSAARRNSGAHLEMAQRQRGSPKPFCGIEETKLDSEKRSGRFSCVPVRLCVCSPRCAHACVCVHPHVVTGLLSAFCFTRARQSRQQRRQQLPTQRPDTHTRTHAHTHTLIVSEFFTQLRSDLFSHESPRPRFLVLWGSLFPVWLPPAEPSVSSCPVFSM